MATDKRNFIYDAVTLCCDSIIYKFPCFYNYQLSFVLIHCKIHYNKVNIVYVLGSLLGSLAEKG